MSHRPVEKNSSRRTMETSLLSPVSSPVSSKVIPRTLPGDGDHRSLDPAASILGLFAVLP